MSITTETPRAKPRYRSPSRSVDASIGLDEFDTDELHAELAHRADQSSKTYDGAGGFVISGDDFSRVQTLALCGQRDAAREHLFTLIENQTGVKL